MNIDLQNELNYDMGGSFNDLVFKKKKEKELDDIKPEMFDYMLGENTTIKLEHIKGIIDENERIDEMAKYLRDEIIKQPLPDEFYTWYARDMLGLKYKKYEIEDMKRQYRINKKREIKKEKEDNKKQKEKDKKNKKCLRYEKKETIIKF
jgi:hypothetical protein